jgi:tetratricopeptide (TPR) repeat protein
MLAVGACALGMATKEVMVTAPLMVLFFDRTFVAPSFGAALRCRWRFYAALAVTWLILVGLLWQGGGNRGGSVGFGVGLDPWAYWLTQLRAVATYLRLTVWPEPLVFEYGVVTVAGLGEVAAEALLVGALLGVTVHGLWRRSAAGFAGAWFFGILAPTSLAPGTTQMIVEHRMYLSLAGVLVVAVAGSFRWMSAAGGRWWLVGWLAVATVAGGLTVRRNGDYATDVGLWRDTVAKRPENPLAHFMLAGALERSGQTEAALASYAEALRLKPNFSVGQENLGELLLKLGRRAEAMARFEAALRLQPEYADAHMNLGNALVAEGRASDAVPHLREAVRIAPRMAEMRFNLGNALAAAGQPEEAIAEFKAALSLKAVNPAVPAAAHYEVANLLAMTGRPAEAVPHYEAVLKARPELAAAQHNLGSALLQLGRFDDAVRAYEAALRLEPNAPSTRALLERAKARQRP